MSVVGFQDFWVVGSRLHFQKETPTGGVVQPLVDLGVIETANPAFEIEKLELEDGDGGVKTVVDESVVSINEAYDITCNNISMTNLALLFQAEEATAYTQTAAEEIVTTYSHAGRLVKMVDNDALATPLFMLSTIAGVLSAPVSAGVLTTSTITAINATTKVITATGDLTTHLAVGEAFVVNALGLANILNSRTYTVVSVVFTSSSAITVNETPAASEVAITGSITYKNATDTGTVYKQDVDWDVYSLDRGVVRLIEGGAIVADGNLTYVFSKAAITGDRLLQPQTLGGTIKGTAWIYWGRGNNANQTVREAQVSITPSASNFSIDDFSNMVLTVTIIGDVTALVPAGRLIAIKGALPTSS